MRTSLSSILTPALFCLGGASLPAQVRVTVDRPSLDPGTSAVLTATLAGAGSAIRWQWSLVRTASSLWAAEEPAGTLTPGPDGTCVYTAPADFLVGTRKLQVRVAAIGSEHPAVIQTLIIATDPVATLFDKILPACGYVETSDLMEPRMGLLAGSPTEKGSWTGPGPAARFSDLNRLAFTGAHPDPRMAGKWLVLDSIGNRIRLMAADGTVEPWLGDAKSGKGYEDGPAAQARFGTLGSISVRPEGPDAGPWRAVIADSWNHVLREVDAHGNVTTLAGMPGQAGYADGAATESQFEAPWDAVYGLDGAVYGIDPVNHSIRKILGGQVTTLAGSRQNRSIQDGTGQEAGFGQPLAIALDPSTSHLYVSDASCIRRVTKDGVVTTLAGGSQPGFEDWMTGPALPEAADRMRGIPCFQAIAGLTVHMGKLYIADSLNHAVRVLDLETGALTTLAGHPDQDRVRPGRLRAGRALDPDRCAALAEPQHVAFDRHGRCLVALSPTHPKAGACIAELSLAGILMADPSPAVAGETKASPFRGSEERKSTPPPRAVPAQAGRE